jgi:H+/Cl- antiporter ClcA
MTSDGTSATPAEPVAMPAASSARQLLALVLPGIVVGVGSALALLVLSVIAGQLEDVLWTWLPQQVGIDGTSPAWTIGMLTAVGLAAGLVVTFVPGHAGPDPATTELTAPPLRASVLPGLAVAVLITLAGGVSLGPENPIIAINVGLAVALGARLLPVMPVPAWAGLAVAGTLGAMFGTPVAAALALSEMTAASPRPLWDRMFGPLVAAAAGSITMLALSAESMVLTIDAYPVPALVDLFTGGTIAAGSAALAMLAIYAFPVVHGAFQRLRSPLVALVVGGFVLGVLGAIGGPLTMFKGLDQMKELTDTSGDYSALQLGSMFLIKMIAVVVAGTCGFRGGRIFPSVFAAVALGLAINTLFPAIPEAVALAGALMGVLVAVTRSGWLSIFMVGLMLGSPATIPLAVVLVLPAWLVVTGRPEMVVKPSEPVPAVPSPA